PIIPSWVHHSETVALPLAVLVGNVASSIALFVAFEGSRFAGRFVAALRCCALVSVLRVVTVVHRAMELVRAMEPRPHSDEGPAVEVRRSVVTVRAATIRRV